jgi:hypothetical protein
VTLKIRVLHVMSGGQHPLSSPIITLDDVVMYRSGACDSRWELSMSISASEGACVMLNPAAEAEANQLAAACQPGPVSCARPTDQWTRVLPQNRSARM